MPRQKATKPLLIGLTGLSGRMETSIVTAIRQAPMMTLSWGIDGHSGYRLNEPLFKETLNDSLSRRPVDFLIDFSRPVKTLIALPIAAKHKIPVVIGTTGFTPAQRKQLDRFARKTSLFLESNMSLGIHLLGRLLETLHPLLSDDFDFEIVEAHHNQKVDAPSGTAISLAERWARLEGHGLPALLDLGRYGRQAKRPARSIGIQSIRGGSIVGDHSLIFAGSSEMLTLSHRALDRTLFAHGALRAGRWLVKQKPGLYSMDDLISEGV